MNIYRVYISIKNIYNIHEYLSEPNHCGIFMTSKLLGCKEKEEEFLSVVETISKGIT